MCSPEPGKAGGRGGKGGRRNYGGSSGGGGGGGGGGGLGGLSEFWSCLDPKQRDSLLTINGRAVREALDCELCRDLVSSATFALEEGGSVFVFFWAAVSSPPLPAGGGGGGVMARVCWWWLVSRTWWWWGWVLALFCRLLPSSSPTATIQDKMLLVASSKVQLFVLTAL